MFLVAARKITSLITHELDVVKLERSPAVMPVLTAAKKSNASYGWTTVGRDFNKNAQKSACDASSHDNCTYALLLLIRS